MKLLKTIGNKSLFFSIKLLFFQSTSNCQNSLFCSRSDFYSLGQSQLFMTRFSSGYYHGFVWIQIKILFKHKMFSLKIIKLRKYFCLDYIVNVYNYNIDLKGRCISSIAHPDFQCIMCLFQPTNNSIVINQKHLTNYQNVYPTNEDSVQPKRSSSVCISFRSYYIPLNSLKTYKSNKKLIVRIFSLLQK